MKNKNLSKRILGLILCLSIVFNIVPMTVSAASTSVPGAEGHILTDIETGTFEGGQESTIIVYSTPDAYNSIKYKVNDNYAIFEIPSYDSSQWYFDGWRTWYKGSLLGLGVTTSDKANPKFDDDLNYFELNEELKVAGGEYYNAGSMSVYKEDSWKGTYYLSAIFKPIVTVNVGDGATYTFSGGTSLDNNKYGVTYGNGATINYSIDSKYTVSGISANFGTDYSVENGKISLNAIVKPATININTTLKPKATYAAPTANDLTYNTQEQKLLTEGTSNEGIFMYSLEENGTYDENVPTAKDTGKYTIWYYVKGDNEHNDSDKASVEVEIKKANPDIGTVSANTINDTTDVSSIVLKRADENVKGSLIIDKEQTLNLGDNEIKYSFIPDDTKNYNQINGTVNVTVKDTIVPTGIVTFTDAETVWDNIPGTITFDMYFKNNQKVVVTATDRFSGVDKVEYYETNEILDLEGVKSITDDKWILMEGDIDLTAEDAKQFIYYIRITDKSGNVAFIATNGAEFDTTAPIISGVYDGKTYYTSQKVTVTDKNLDTVTLNGQPAQETIILEGNKEATYTIVATDKAGNSTTVTVKMTVLDDIIDINLDEVTPEDKNELEDVKGELEKNLQNNSDIYSEEEKKAIEDKIKAIEEALKIIENNELEIEDTNTEDINNVKNPITGDNIEIYVAMFIVSILGISAMILIKKKNSK